MLSRLRTAEKAVLQTLAGQAGNELAVHILRAPDQFYAAAIMQREGTQIGTAVFQNIVDALKQGYDPEYKAIADKLRIFDQGKLMGNGGKTQIAIYADSERPHGTMNKTLAFKIWANYIYLHPESGLTTAHLIEMFPALEGHLKVYDECMDEHGKVVRNQAYYEEYEMNEGACDGEAMNPYVLFLLFLDGRKNFGYTARTR